MLPHLLLSSVHSHICALVCILSYLCSHLCAPSFLPRDGMFHLFLFTLFGVPCRCNFWAAHQGKCECKHCMACIGFTRPKDLASQHRSNAPKTEAGGARRATGHLPNHSGPRPHLRPARWPPVKRKDKTLLGARCSTRQMKSCREKPRRPRSGCRSLSAFRHNVRDNNTSCARASSAEALATRHKPRRNLNTPYF